MSRRATSTSATACLLAGRSQGRRVWGRSGGGLGATAVAPPSGVHVCVQVWATPLFCACKLCLWPCVHGTDCAHWATARARGAAPLSALCASPSVFQSHLGLASVPRGWAPVQGGAQASCPPGGAGELRAAHRQALPDGAEPAALPVRAAARVPGLGAEQARRPLLPLRRGGGEQGSGAGPAAGAGLTPRPRRRSSCTRTSRARWRTAAWGRRCGPRP